MDPGEVNYALTLIIDKWIEVSPRPSGIQLIDMEDLAFYEVVLEKKEDGAYLITTSNKSHFPSEPIVVTAAEFLEIIGETK